jgi:hypothetical protein
MYKNIIPDTINVFAITTEKKSGITILRVLRSSPVRKKVGNNAKYLKYFF